MAGEVKDIEEYWLQDHSKRLLIFIVFVLMADEVLCQSFTSQVSLQLLQHEDEHAIAKGERFICFPLGDPVLRVLHWLTLCHTT